MKNLFYIWLSDSDMLKAQWFISYKYLKNITGVYTNFPKNKVLWTVPYNAPLKMWAHQSGRLHRYPDDGALGYSLTLFIYFSFWCSVGVLILPSTFKYLQYYLFDAT